MIAFEAVRRIIRHFRPAPTEASATRGVPFLVVLTGNPNCGKTTLFNVLTGLRAKVGNYAGVTVERKEGRLTGIDAASPIDVLDLPGAYSLCPQSLDEQIAGDVLFHRVQDVPPPDLIVVVVDASNLERNLYCATQVIELGYPTLVALNMMDVARDNGHLVDAAKLQKQLGVPVFPTVASTRKGVAALRSRILSVHRGEVAPGPVPLFANLPDPFEQEAAALARLLSEKAFANRSQCARPAARLILSDEKSLVSVPVLYGPAVRDFVIAARGRLQAAGLDWRTLPIESRYARVSAIYDAAVTESVVVGETPSDRLDRVLTHRILGLVIFTALMALMFQSIFAFAKLPMTALEAGVTWLGSGVAHMLPPGDLRSLLVDGVLAGVGAVVVFLPQICLLFLFIGLLEDTGYMARAAFIMDRLMNTVGLHGKSFIPLLSSFACAIPGIMAARTIENARDRLVTILIAPLMTCWARLPVYTVLIAACIPDTRALGFIKWPGLTLLSMYALGIVAALAAAWMFKRTLLKGRSPMLVVELPPYRRPMLMTVLRHMWDRAAVFLRQAGTVILGINILLWFLASYPRNANVERPYREARRVLDARLAQSGSDTERSAFREQIERLGEEQAGARLRNSVAGHMGRWIEPIIRPLGFDWKIGVGIITSFAAREVFVSTMSVVYSVGRAEEAEGESLALTLRRQVRPDGRPQYTMLMGISLMVFYVFALQCASTVVIVRRETNGWKWPLFQWAYLGALAWMATFLTFQGGRLLGFQ